MDIQEAKKIPLFRLVQSLGGKYSHTDRNKQLWYFSPFRPNEKTASFVIHEQKNRWFDFGHVARNKGGNGSGGDIIDLWCDFYGKDRRAFLRDALSSLVDFSTNASSPHDIRPVERIKETELPSTPRFQIIRRHDKIFYDSLLRELERRRISLELANHYLKQVYLQDTAFPEKRLNGFAFSNDEGGFEISVPNPAKGSTFKTSTKPKSYSTIQTSLSKKLWVFEGMWDFLSWLQMQNTHDPTHNVVVLNSLSFCGEVTQLIIDAKDKIEVVLLFLDNDEAGIKATHYMVEELEEAGFIVGTMEGIYKGYKDLSEFWSIDPDARKVSDQNTLTKKYYTDDGAWSLVVRQDKPSKP